MFRLWCIVSMFAFNVIFVSRLKYVSPLSKKILKYEFMHSGWIIHIE